MYIDILSDNYNIDISKMKKDEKIIDELILLVENKILKFPYKKTYINNPLILFNNLKNINLDVSHKPYKLYSYFPKYGAFLPHRFRNKQTSIISCTNEIYYNADVLSDYFIEDIRIKTHRHNEKQSVYKAWENKAFLKKIFNLALQKQEFNPENIRTIITQNISENKVFNPTWAKSLIKLVLGDDIIGKKWLDISAGWGDRLITAMSLNMEYLGFDPNTDLINGHNKMIELFGDTNKHKIIYEPFETSIVPPNKFDIILSSPPFFNVEEYSSSQNTQSIIKFPNFNEWMIKFLFTSLLKAWISLKIGGYLVLHICDTFNLRLAEPTNLFIRNFLINSSFEGIIGIKGMSGYTRPVWVWKKLDTPKTFTYKNENTNSLKNSYNQLYKNWIKNKI